jgi:hypothetical protein
MIYNYAFDANRIPHSVGYENSQFFSRHFQDYAREISGRLVERYHLYDKNILDIGSGPGGLLDILCEGGRNRGFAFDPYAAVGCQSWAEDAPITFIRDYYSEAYANILGDFIICRHILEHFQSPRDFLFMLRRTIAGRSNAVGFFEVPNATWILDTASIGDIFYEHCSYFSSASLGRLLGEAGFEVLSMYPAFHEQFLCAEARPARFARPPFTAATQELQALSTRVATFGERYRSKLDQWNRELNHLRANRSRIVVWGAGSKGVSFLNAVDAADEIKYVVDINPHKQEKYVVGTAQKIVAPEFLREYQPQAVLVTNHAYKDEVEGILGGLGLSPQITVL